MENEMTSKIHSDGDISKKHKKKEPEIVATDEYFGAAKALLKRVKKQLKKGISKKQKDLIVFCPITSRVGSDVEAAMDKAKSGQSLILVLMHHTRDPDYSTAGTQWSETIDNVVLDVHVLFHESVPGLLKCSQNDKAVAQIVNFFKEKKKDTKQDQPKEKKNKEGSKSKEKK